ncbi:MarR family transcriptional regulator [Aquabacterium sp.]|uniref:MarR family winged helix-turn-helix transcriptional regulator n=1 Tax=Aquabacterium sp. TaxID=1872578 RepID=UPI0025B982D8|nr:MarR family transcriptional regulator [Aquabacterium sp.]
MSNAFKNPRLIFLLNSAQRSLQAWMTALQAQLSTADEVMPTPAQAGLLFTLQQTDGATMGQLSRALQLVPSAMSGLVQRTEALDWVARHPDPEDGRTQRVWLRPAGLAQLPRLKPITQRINRQLSQGFTEAELAVVARWLTHVQQLDTTP